MSTAAVDAQALRYSPQTLALFDRWATLHHGHVTTYIADGFMGLGLCLAVFSNSYGSPLVALTWASLALGFWLSPDKGIGPRPVFLGMLLLVGALLLAVPGSLIWGGQWIGSAFLTFWIAPFFILYLVNNSSRVLAWIPLAAVIHAGVVLYQGMIEGTYRASGLLTNSNPAGGFLVLGSIYLLTTRFWWLSVVTMTGLAFTGSRGATLSLVIALVLLVATKQVPWRAVLSVCLAVALLTWPVWGLLHTNYRLPDPVSELEVSVLHLEAGMALPPLPTREEVLSVIEQLPGKLGHDIKHRWNVQQAINFAPRGYLPDITHPHNVALRIANDLGILAALAWVAITVYALWRRPGRGTTTWWLLVTVALLGIMDYYMYAGTLAGFWWLLVGRQVKERELANDTTRTAVLPNPRPRGPGADGLVSP